ncbi:MAG: C-GCAxxG-C-C family protein, partial [Bacteroides sp.]
PKDREGKAANYALVQELAAIFKERNGSINCGELLGLKKTTPIISEPEERTPQYYAKRPCVKTVEEAARIWVEHLEKGIKEAE